MGDCAFMARASEPVIADIGSFSIHLPGRVLLATEPWRARALPVEWASTGSPPIATHDGSWRAPGERLGFTREAAFHTALRDGDALGDEYVYGLAEPWRERSTVSA